MTPFVPDRADAWRSLGLLMVGLLVLAAVLYAPLLRPWWQTEFRLWALRNSIEATRSIQARAAEIDAALSAAREHALASGDYLSEPTVALANAALAVRIQDAVNAAVTEESVCILGNRAPLGSAEGSHCSEARIRVDLQCGTDSLEQVLRALETQAPRLRIDQMELALAPNPLGFDKPSSGNEPLRVSLEVGGCLLPTPLAGGDAPGWTTP